MNYMPKNSSAYLFRLSLLAVALLATSASADRAVTSSAEMRQVLGIAKGIIAVQPFLPNARYVEYAMGIYRAAQRYQIEPKLLIAIAQQESGFRDNLPEGKAGELGICQILKQWRENDRFREEFGEVSTDDLKKPAKSFLYAAWILKGLREDTAHSALPYWSYYNSTQFSNRLKYYLHVNKRLALLKKKAPEIYHLAAPAAAERMIAAAAPAPTPVVAAPVALPGLQTVTAQNTTAAPAEKRSIPSAFDMAKLLTRSASFGEIASD